MARFIIRGGRPLRGRVNPSGNKNAALPMIAASLLTDQPVVLRNVPDIVDVRVMLELVASLGVGVERAGDTVTLRAATLRRRSLNRDLCRRVRSSILLAGPLAARHGSAVLHPPGGDVIGRRRLDTHFYGLQSLGIDIEGGERYSLRRRGLHGADLLLDEASVTATENILMAASIAPGRTTIYNAAGEPHVRDLGLLLVKMGARIDGLGTNRIRIEGVPALGGADFTLGPDYIEAFSYLAAAAATGGELTVPGLPASGDARGILRVFERLGIAIREDGDGLALGARQKRRVRHDLNGSAPKIEDGPWPSFPSDLMSVAIVLATQVKGSALFFEKMFESRMYFVDRLIEMGAPIIQCDPHRIVVNGPARLHGAVLTSPDIRAGIALVIAALCARGTSVIEQIQMVDRGYQDVDGHLRALGADIEREN